LEVDQVTKRLSVSLIALAVTLVLIPAVSVQAKPIKCEFDLDRYPTLPKWVGPILTGEFGLAEDGTSRFIILFYNTANKDPNIDGPNAIHHFWEIWEIRAGDYTLYDPADPEGFPLVLRGDDKGVVTWKNDKYQMNGEITEVGVDFPQYSYLLGHQIHMNGVITYDPLKAPGFIRIN